MLPLGGLHVKHAVQCGIWVQTQNLLCDQEKPRKTLIKMVVAGPSGSKLTSCQQSGIKYAIPTIIPYLCFCFIEKHLQFVLTNTFM
jgi:CTP synthase (UTP-ammonia lyase)